MGIGKIYEVHVRYTGMSRVWYKYGFVVQI